MLLPVTEHTIDLDVPPGTALAAVGQTAEDWGAEFVREGEGGKLHLPVIAGMRRGLLTGPVTVEPAGEALVLHGRNGSAFGGFGDDRLLASYLHLHLGGDPTPASRFVRVALA